jgi:hypothetical protein
VGPNGAGARAKLEAEGKQDNAAIIAVLRSLIAAPR